MKSKKLLIIIPDGVGIRNFVYTQFPKVLADAGWDVVFLNMTQYNLGEFRLREIKLTPKPSFKTDLFKRAKILIELNQFKKRSNNAVYDKYKFFPSTKGLRNKVKNHIVETLYRKYNSEDGIALLREKMKKSERGTEFYGTCKEILNRENPDLVFCTNQRPVNAVSPITAAQDRGIPTACFIFSWDNLPKATKIIDADYYFVWSEHMREELLHYYPYINSKQIRITGTPQFEIHQDKSVIISRDEFFDRFNLEKEKEYLCFSGDDVTTSPHDERFLWDVAEEIELLNKKGHNLGIIFRRCPVDFSDRYNDILNKYENLIFPIKPAWTNEGAYWNESMPQREDLVLQTNIIEHSFMVINVGSSMVFDYAAKQKPCAYLNYVPIVKNLEKDIREVYSYTHFSSMPENNSVYWINKKSDIGQTVENALDNPSNVVENAKKWFYKINNFPNDGASIQIVRQLDSIL